MEERIRSYQSRISELQTQFEDLSAKSKRFSLLRLAIIIIGSIAVFTLGQVSAIAVIASIIATFILFAIVLKKHDRIDKARKHAELMIKINENEITALMRLENLYYDGVDYDKPGHYYTNDLDVFGPYSLFGIINRSRTYHGNVLLGKWFAEKPELKEIVERTTAVQELETDPLWRQDFLADLFEMEDGHSTNFAVKVKEQLDGNLDFINATWLKIYRMLVPFIWLAIIVGAYFDWSLAGKLAISFLIINLAVSMKYVGPISEIQMQLAKSGSLLEKFMKGLHRIMDRTWMTPLNQSKVNAFTSNAKDENSPIQILSELKTIIDQLDYRLNIIAAFLLNGTMLWDLKMMDKLAAWKADHLDKIEEIFELIGYFESITSLSTWAYNYPNYNYAALDEDHFHLSTKGIMHPLIPVGQNVANDFEITKQGRVNIVTGSNMAGKSTFLRSVGTNMILAYTGTKVAADYLNTSVVQLMSYMRIKDALEENVSTFKAELNRVELMLSLVKNKSKSLILIDEMLRGTNSKDKLKGSINITKKLISEEAFAMIATHEL